jgi:hypothetical protein
VTAASRPGRLAVTGVAALAAAALSLLLGHALRFDPHGWLRWGREIALGDGRFDTSGYPSWKPLPLVLAIPLAPTGPAAPWLWLLTLRTVGFLTLGLLARLTARRSGWAGGLTAAALLALAPGWWPTMLGGGIEPVVVALGCAAVMAHRAGRPGPALALLAAMALGREEALALLVAYGAWQSHRGRLPLWWTAATAGAVATAWLLGDQLGSGDPLHGGALARAAQTAAPFTHLDTLESVAAAVLGPPFVALVILGVLTAIRREDRTTLAVAAAALAWVGIDLVLLAAGYPLPPRFLLPAAAGLAATAGAAVPAVRRPAARPPLAH